MNPEDLTTNRRETNLNLIYNNIEFNFGCQLKWIYSELNIIERSQVSNAHYYDAIVKYRLVRHAPASLFGRSWRKMFASLFAFSWYMEFYRGNNGTMNSFGMRWVMSEKWYQYGLSKVIVGSYLYLLCMRNAKFPQTLRMYTVSMRSYITPTNIINVNVFVFHYF